MHPAPMPHRKNRKVQMPWRLLLPWLLAAMLLLAALVLVTAPWVPDSLIASAQKVGQKQPRSASQRSKAAPPKTTPAGSGFDSLGEPPPPPKLATPKPTPKPEPELNPGDVISVDTTEVMLPVSVRDANGRFASELVRQDFRVFEDNLEQPLSDLALRQVPVDVVLMVDASSSVASMLDDFRRATDGFATRLATDDRIS